MGCGYEPVNHLVAPENYKSEVMYIPPMSSELPSAKASREEWPVRVIEGRNDGFRSR